MTRRRIVGGKIIETTGGDYNIYTKENIIYNLQQLLQKRVLKKVLVMENQ